MKYVKYTLIVLAVLIVGFFLLGLVKPELTYDCEIMIDKPLAEAWAVSQDESKMPEWLTGFQKVEHISGTKGTIGAVSDVYFVNEGQEMVIRETINEIVPSESIRMTFESDFMVMDYVLAMEEADGKTKITTNTQVEGNGMISKSIIALMGGSFEEQEETNLSLLKKTIEGNTNDYSAE